MFKRLAQLTHLCILSSYQLTDLEMLSVVIRLDVRYDGRHTVADRVEVPGIVLEKHNYNITHLALRYVKGMRETITTLKQEVQFTFILFLSLQF